MAQVEYPPRMPLLTHPVGDPDAPAVRYLTPLPYRTIATITGALFLTGLGVLAAMYHHWLPAAWHISAQHTLLAVSLIPPFVISLLLLLAPLVGSPTRAYQSAASRRPQDLRLRWNLAVVATADVYAGTTAQSEWLSQLVWLADGDRQRAFAYIQRVRERLQAVPPLPWRDVLFTLIAGVATVAVSTVALRYTIFEAILHSIALLVVLQLLLFYFYLQRWQHVRRLQDLEDVFEELLPSERPALPAAVAQEDEYTRWLREQEPQAAPAPPSEAATPEEHSAFLRLWQ
jgi:hypothetical protein